MVIPEPPSDQAPGPEQDFEPMRRDRGFLYRLIAALLAGTIAAAFVGWKIQTASAGCGRGLIRTVVPAETP